MSDELQAAELLEELQLTRKHLMKGIRLAVKRLGTDAREVCIGRTVLRQIDELIRDQEIEAGSPAVTPLVRVRKDSAG